MKPKGRYYSFKHDGYNGGLRQIPDSYWGPKSIYLFPAHWEREMINKFKMYLSRCLERGMNFDLSFDLFESMFNSRCVYCGDSKRITIDRIDSKIGYVKDNIQPA